MAIMVTGARPPSGLPTGLLHQRGLPMGHPHPHVLPMVLLHRLDPQHPRGNPHQTFHPEQIHLQGQPVTEAVAGAAVMAEAGAAVAA